MERQGILRRVFMGSEGLTTRRSLPKLPDRGFVWELRLRQQRVVQSELDVCFSGSLARSHKKIEPPCLWFNEVTGCYASCRRDVQAWSRSPN